MVNYDWSLYHRPWSGWPLKKQGEFLADNLQLYGDPIALVWFPLNSLPPKLEKYIYKGDLKLVHCQFMQRARFRGGTYILDGITSQPESACDGDAYAGLTSVRERNISWNQRLETPYVTWCERRTKKEGRSPKNIKGEINLVPYEMPSELRKTIESFVEYYNHRRYHEALGNVTPADVYFGRRNEILAQRKEANRKTLQARREHNQRLSKLDKNTTTG